MKVLQFVAPQWVGEFYRPESQMVIAPWCLHPTYGKAYTNFWREHPVDILDNEIFEKLQAPPVPLELDDICRQVRPRIVVLPDKLGDPTVTHWESKAALGIIGQRTRVQVMFVPHAHTFDQWQQSFGAWLTMWYRESWDGVYREPWIGISSLRREKGSVWPKVGSRIQLIRFMQEFYPYLHTHLLGISTIREFVENELPVAIECGVASVDTPVAFALGARGIELTPTAKKAFLGDIREYDTLTAEKIALIHHNQESLRKWVSSEVL